MAQPMQAPLSLDEVLQAARNNLDSAMASRGLAAARADVLAADHAPLPVLSAKTASIDLQNGVGGGNWLTQKRVDKAIGLDWTWERGNKRALRTQAAQGAAQAAQADLDEVRTQQQLAGHGAFYDLLSADERLEEVRQIERGTRQLAASAARRVQAGDLAAQDASRIDIEARRAQLDVQAAVLERQRAAVQLAQLLGHANGSPDPGTLRVRPEWPSLGPWAEANGAMESLIANRPDVRAAQARVDAAQAVRDAALALTKNDLTWGASYDHYPGNSTRLLEFRVQLPLQWGYSYQGEIGRAEAQLDLARDSLEKTRLLARTEWLRLRQELASAAERAHAYANDILPRARAVADRAELAYQRGATPLSDLLDARRTLRATLLDALAARAEHARAWGAWRLRTQGIAPIAPPVNAPPDADLARHHTDTPLPR